MFTLKQARNFVYYLVTLPLKIIRYVAEAAIRIFGPNDDEYPNIGVQPFEGESAGSNSW
ncbi:MAG: hypothetical protein HXY43_15355 [Fischerella sp.]|jgi:hypothetical protein|uniref:hypothetical protein n=1 Tax=unclassified Fischerella TaxID=494603 RepID=UPI0004ACE32E|nr:MULTISPECIES: hypothetical protein [unclassified Fischerella]NWF60591.1 hypothetical protein [Fischerella sp.]